MEWRLKHSTTWARSPQRTCQRLCAAVTSPMSASCTYGHNRAVTFPLTGLVKGMDRFGFIAGYSRTEFSSESEAMADADADAARLRAGPYDASVLLTRIPFQVFGDDTGMWDKDLFVEFVETRTEADGSHCGPSLAHLSCREPPRFPSHPGLFAVHSRPPRQLRVHR